MKLSDIRKVMQANGEKANADVDRVDITLRNGEPSVMHVMFTDGRLGEFDAKLPEAEEPTEEPTEEPEPTDPTPVAEAEGADSKPMAEDE